jgi:hypothetical protein
VSDNDVDVERRVRKEGVCQKLRLHCVSEFARIRGSLLPRNHATHVIGQSAETLTNVEAPYVPRPRQTSTTSLESICSPSQKIEPRLVPQTLDTRQEFVR